MPNRNYLKGREAEWAVKRDLERLGFSCVRAAASQGVFDVIGVRADSIALVQVKRGERPSPCEYRSLVDLAVPEGTVKLLVWYPPRLSAARVLYHNQATLPGWCGLVRWLEGDIPKQRALRLA